MDESFPESLWLRSKKDTPPKLQPQRDALAWLSRCSGPHSSPPEPVPGAAHWHLPSKCLPSAFSSSILCLLPAESQLGEGAWEPRVLARAAHPGPVVTHGFGVGMQAPRAQLGAGGRRAAPLRAGALFPASAQPPALQLRPLLSSLQTEDAGLQPPLRALSFQVLVIKVRPRPPAACGSGESHLTSFPSPAAHNASLKGPMTSAREMKTKLPGTD